MSQRKEILELLSGKKNKSKPAFSGLIHVTAEGLQSEGITLQEAHQHAQKMANAAASTFRLIGLPSAALPLDLCAPAEMQGAELEFYDNGEYRFPQVKKPLVESAREIALDPPGPPSIGSPKGRLQMICEAIALVHQDIGSKVVVSGLIPGPFTLLLYLCNPKNLFVEMKKEPAIVHGALLRLSIILEQLAKEYRNAGADFITIHEMGGSPSFIGPARFEEFVFPALKQLISDLPKPTVLSVCGNTNRSMELLAQTGAEAISVDQTNDLAMSRIALRDVLLFGNLDPVGTLFQGGESDITDAVRRGEEAGVDAVWPGCDLVPNTSIENLKAWMAAGHL